MVKLRLLLLFSIIFHVGNAQYTEVINSKRPGYSDSPYSVGTDVYQIEAGLFYKNIGNYLFFNQQTQEANRYKSLLYGTDVTIRASKFLEKLELDVDLAFAREHREHLSPITFDETKIGLTKFTVGAKYLVYMPTYTDKTKEIRSWKKRNSFDKKRLIPAVGVYAGLNTNFVTDLQKNPDGMSPRFAVFTQNNISDKFIVLTNWIADYMFTDYTEYSFILTTTYSFTDKVSAFGEGQIFRRKNVPNDIQYGIGGAYLIDKNLQVDGAVRFINDERGDHTFFVGLGGSWRFDKHTDKHQLLDADGNLNEKKEGNFFSRLLGKNNDEPRKVKQVKAKKRKVKELKSKKDKELAKKAKKDAKEARKNEKKKEKDYKKNYEPPSNDN
jgi:hypothetical protein